jgi:acyl-coenzyme A thioesterase PaaI-like protein
MIFAAKAVQSKFILRDKIFCFRFSGLFCSRNKITSAMNFELLSQIFASSIQGEGLPMLNQGLNMMIPFNEPHKFEIVDLKNFSIKTKIPYIKSNFNHLQGLHAGALMTISEFTTGIMILMHANPQKYRLILQKLEIDYVYQGKKDAYATFEVEPDFLQKNVIEPLKTEDAVLVPCKVETRDEDGNLLCVATVYWQLKAWEKVRTKQ